MGLDAFQISRFSREAANKRLHLAVGYTFPQVIYGSLAASDINGR